MEITITELVLFTWAIIATGFAFKFREEKGHISLLFNEMLANPEARDRMLTSYNKWKEARDGR